MSRRIVVWGCLLGIAAAILWLSGSHAPPPDASPHEEPARSDVTATADADPATAEPHHPATDREPAPRTATAPTTSPTQAGGAVVRGRCVDEQARPLAGVTLSLRGFPSSVERLDHHRLEHGAIEWTDPAPVITASDGRFELCFEPPPPYAFTLLTSAIRRAQLTARWNELGRDALVDLGDIALPPGVSVRGRVVDGNDAGIAAVEVSLVDSAANRDPREGVVRMLHTVSGHTDADGWFEVAAPIVPGRWRVEARDRRVSIPNGPIDIALPSADLRIVLAALPPEAPAISGFVVDAGGAPWAVSR